MVHLTLLKIYLGIEYSCVEIVSMAGFVCGLRDLPVFDSFVNFTGFSLLGVCCSADLTFALSFEFLYKFPRVLCAED